MMLTVVGHRAHARLSHGHGGNDHLDHGLGRQRVRHAPGEHGDQGRDRDDDRGFGTTTRVRSAAPPA